MLTCAQDNRQVFHRVRRMLPNLILASNSAVRSALLQQAGLLHETKGAKIDEASVKSALLAEGASARDVADTLAELKARKVAEKAAAGIVIGCDQTLSLGTRLFSKPTTLADAMTQIHDLQGQTHHLYSAVVLYEDKRPVWRHVAQARMTMRSLSETFIADYTARNWPAISTSVGGYLIEGEGITLFSAIEGEHTAILGLPLPPLISYLAIRGFIAT